MARKPSKRRHFSEPDQELNLIPMMNLISLLIPCLLISMVFIEIATINVAGGFLVTQRMLRMFRK